MATPSFQDLFNLGKAESTLLRPELSVRLGSIAEMLIAAAAAMADRLVGWFAERVASTFLDGAIGDDLTKLSADHWAINRNPAEQSVAQVTFNRASADGTSQTFPIGTVVATTADSTGNAVQFVTTTGASWASSTNGNRTVNVQAVIAGVNGNLAGANLINKIISTPPAGGLYTITSSTQPAGGSDEETDDSLRDRVRLYPSTLRRGTIAALQYGAQQTPGISIVKANAVQDTTGLVTVYVSDSSGNSTGTTRTVGPDLVDDGTMTMKAAIELFDWAAAGALVEVSGGVVQTVNITVTIVVKLGVDVNQLISDIQASVQARVGKLNIGDTLYLSDIMTAVKAVDPDNIVNVVVVTPVVDTAPSTPGSLIRAGVITVN
jgi:uncharacterized phage protein gp47/JayE